MEQLFREIAELKRRVAELETQEKPGIWTDWTPTVTQSGSVTVTVTFAKYFTDGKLVVLRANLAVTGTGTANNDIVIGGIPASVQPSFHSTSVIGTGLVTNAGTAYYQGALVAISATDFRIYIHNFTPLAGSAIGSNPNFALANGDAISFQATYERA